MLRKYSPYTYRYLYRRKKKSCAINSEFFNRTRKKKKRKGAGKIVDAPADTTYLIPRYFSSYIVSRRVAAAAPKGFLFSNLSWPLIAISAIFSPQCAMVFSRFKFHFTQIRIEDMVSLSLSLTCGRWMYAGSSWEIDLFGKRKKNLLMNNKFKQRHRWNSCSSSSFSDLFFTSRETISFFSWKSRCV